MKNTFYKAALFGILVFVVINNFVFSPSNILSWDVFGYYLYLPFKFIYNDLGLRNMDVVHSIIEKYNNTATFYQAVQMPEGHYVMKYPMGLSFIYDPSFLLAICLQAFPLSLLMVFLRLTGFPFLLEVFFMRYWEYGFYQKFFGIFSTLRLQYYP